MKQALLLFFFIVTQSAYAQDIVGTAVVMGHTDSIQSKILSEKRTIWVHLPAGAAGKNNTSRYPVVYVLDGPEHFASVSGIIQYLSEANGNMFCPDMIVVGINNTDRTRDLTPTYGAFDYENKPTSSYKTSGGGEKFTAFIEKELMPYIEGKYPTAPFRMLVGHSFGGLAAVNILLNHTELFNAYTIVDPSMWWDRCKLLKQAHDVLKRKSFAGKYVFMGIANTMPAGDDTLHAHHDTSAKTNHIRAILNLADELKENPGNGLTFNYKFYNADNHSSSPLITEYDAFRFLFNYYKLPKETDDALFDANAKIDVAAVIEDHYSDVSKRMGYTVLPPETILDAVGHDYLKVNLPGRALAVFTLNAKYYPNNAAVNTAMGDYYTAQKNKTKAAEFYNKSLMIKKDQATRDKLSKLKDLK
ncbi:MAG: alpha/beta hydrolase-fold protein [Mucilaginibacter sp.]